MEDFVRSEKLKEVQQVGCRLLDEFARICKEHNLRWFVDSGTLLGAIRHGGFIPWDDDIDVIMPREDYNRLNQLGNSVTKEPFYLQTTKDALCSVELLLKDSSTTKIKETDCYELLGSPDKKFLGNKGIAMDIAMLDHVPSDIKRRESIVQFLSALHQYYLQNVVTFSYSNGIKFNYDNFQAMAAQMESELTKSDLENKNSGYMGCTTWWINPKYFGCSVSSSCYDDYIEMDFAGCEEKVRVPVGYDEILTAYYGNWHVEQQGLSLHENTNYILDTAKSFKDYEAKGFINLMAELKNAETDKIIQVSGGIIG